MQSTLRPKWMIVVLVMVLTFCAAIIMNPTCWDNIMGACFGMGFGATMLIVAWMLFQDCGIHCMLSGHKEHKLNDKPMYQINFYVCERCGDHRTEVLDAQSDEW